MPTFTYDYILDHVEDPTTLITTDEEFFAAIEFLCVEIVRVNFTEREILALEVLVPAITTYYDTHPTSRTILQSHDALGVALQVAMRHIMWFELGEILAEGFDDER